MWVAQQTQPLRQAVGRSEWAETVSGTRPACGEAGRSWSGYGRDAQEVGWSGCLKGTPGEARLEGSIYPLPFLSLQLIRERPNAGKD